MLDVLLKMTTLIITLLLTLTIAISAQTASFSKDGSLVIKEGNKRILLNNISQEIRHVPRSPCVHAIQKRKGDYYLLITTSQFTRGFPPRSGAGGNGEEFYLRWLHVAEGKIGQSTEHKINSWSDNCHGAVIGWSGSVFSAISDNLMEGKLHATGEAIWQTNTFSFNSNKPEDGIKTQTKFEKQLKFKVIKMQKGAVANPLRRRFCQAL